jgi:threonine/homoserine/homoserine lactone efflux protein
LVIVHAAWLYTAIRIAGALYLIFLGAKMLWQAKKSAAPDVAAAEQSEGAIFRKAYFVSLTNPKSAAFYGSVLAVMLPPHAPLWFSAAVVAIAVLLSALWYCSVAFLLSTDTVRRRFARIKTLFDTVIGVILMGLGAKLLTGV